MNLRPLLDSLLPSFRRELACQRCGERFRCEASLAGCWCSEIKLSDEARAELARAGYKDCLCHKCLETFAAPRQTS